MSFSKTDYETSCHDYRENWAALDKVLYDLCDQCPDHQNRASVNAKLWVIGRTYATGIERKIKSTGSQGSSMKRLADHIWTHRAAVDAIITSLDGYQGSLTIDALKRIQEGHGQFVRLVRPLLIDEQSARSFVSKYLHFHRSAVPIYDTVAQAALRSVIRWRDTFLVFQQPEHADSDYARFSFRFWQLHTTAQSSGAAVTVKHLDHYILALAHEER
jgi:hypothetical protein